MPKLKEIIIITIIINITNKTLLHPKVKSRSKKSTVTEVKKLPVQNAKQLLVSGDGHR
jgi:SpoU rRNA methylase family enzyme